MAEDDASTQGVPPQDDPVSPTAKKRRRRRRKPAGTTPSPASESPRVDSASAFSLSEDEATEALEEPRSSVLDLEDSRSTSAPSSYSVQVSPVEETAKASDEMVYEAPIYNPSPPPAPVYEPVLDSSPVEVPHVEPVTEPAVDPFAYTPDPYSQPQEAPFAPGGPSADPFGPSYANSGTPPPYDDPFGDYQSAFASPPPASSSASSSEPSPFDLAASFQSSPSPSAASQSSFDPVPEPVPYTPEPYVPPSPSPFDVPSVSQSEPQPEPQPEPVFIATPPPQEEEPLEAELVDRPAPNLSASVSQKANDLGLNELALEGGIGERFQHLLAEANLTTRHVKFCCAGLLAAVVVILLAVFLVPRLLNGGFSFFDSSDEPTQEEPVTEEPVTEEPVTEEPVTEEPDTEEPDEDGPVPLPNDDEPEGPIWVDPSVYNSLLLGESTPEFRGSTGVDPGFLLGQNEVAAPQGPSKFQGFVTDLGSMYNIYFVDLQALLDSSSDRGEALDAHIQAIKDLYNVGVQNYDEMGQILDQLSADFDVMTPTKDAAEAQFFAELDAFQGSRAEEKLLDFIDVKKDQVELKAEFLAFKQLRGMYERVMGALEPLVRDLELNRESLISGVQVVDVLGSDLDLILSETELEQ